MKKVSLLAIVIASMFSTVSFASNGAASEAMTDVQMVSSQVQADVFGDYQPIEAKNICLHL